MYIFESGFCLPFIIIFPFSSLIMSTFLSSNTAQHSLLQKFPIDRKALSRPGNICAFCASIVSSVLESSAMCVEVIISLFGMQIGSGMTVICLLSHGESRVS